MSNFIVIGPVNRQSAICASVFRDVCDGAVPNARYMNITDLFGPLRLAYHALYNRRLKYLLRGSPALTKASIRAANAVLRHSHRVHFRKLEALISPDADNYIIFLPGIRLHLLPPSAIESIRERHPECHLIFYFVDALERAASVNSLSEGDILAYLSHYDAVYTYDRADAARFAGRMRFVDIPLWHAPAPAPSAPEADLYFCGRNKKRGELLLAIHRRLSDAGMRCRMQIAGEEGMAGTLPGVTHSSWVPYEDTVAELNRANCVLEVLAAFNKEPTLRYKEAVIYNKKFLTNNPDIASLPYYDPRWMRSFQTAQDIDLDWLRAVEPVDYGYRGEYGAETFFKRVEEEFSRGRGTP